MHKGKEPIDLIIRHRVRLRDSEVLRDGISLFPAEPGNADLSVTGIYSSLKLNYPKFYKMDVLSKAAWLAAEVLLTEADIPVYQHLDRSRIAVVLFTTHGCLSIDKKYNQSIRSIPSPALFVYTLNNIMLGEICIRHGFKGEQTCIASDGFDETELCFAVNDLLTNRDMDACLCGWVDAGSNQHDVSMFWVGKGGDGLIFSPAVLRQLYTS